MNGIQSLMGQLMPGQAPLQPLPGVMPQPGAPTPGAMTSSLKNMSLDQLKALYQNPNPNSPPLWAVISALAEKQKEAQAMMAAQGQAAMAQNQQMQQQPPVAAQVVEAAEQMEEPVMAMHGGEMHGYAGGGAVAFQNGGRTFGYAPDYELARKYGINLSPYDSPEVRAEKIKRARAMEGFEEQAKSFGEIPTEASVARDALLQRAFADPSRSRDVLSAKMPEVTRPNLPVDSGISTGRAPQQSATMFDITSPASINALRLAAQDTSLPEAERADLRKRIAMMEQQAPSRTRGIGAPVEPTGTPAIDARAAAAAAEQAAMLRRGEITPEMIAARGGIDKLLGASVSGFEAERKRRDAAAQQRMQEAQARFERRGLEDMAGIGRLLSGMRGAKTLYEGLTGAGAAAGKYQEDKEAALRAAQEKFDLSNREVFELSRLQDQVRMKQAELAEARASGDAQRSVQAAIDVAQSQKQLAEYQTNLVITREKLRLEEARITSTENIAELNRRAQESVRNLPGPEQQMAKQVMDDYMRNNPGATLSDAYEFYRGAGKGLEERAKALRERNEIARQKLLESDMMYAAFRMAYINATDPAKKADALRRMKEIERMKGIVDEGEAASTLLPPGVTVKRIGQ